MGAQSEIVLQKQPPVAILSHSTAYSYYLTLDPARPDAARACDDDVLEQSSASAGVLRDLGFEYPVFEARPLEVLVSSGRKRRKSSQIKTHLCTAQLQPGSFWKLSDSLYIASPELTFVQMASSLNFVQLVVLGSCLCAKFFVDPVSMDVVEREPVTTPDKLARYLENHPGVYGSAQARKALERVAAGSTSLVDVKLRSLAGLALHYGGYGFRHSVFNQRVDLGKYAHLAERDYFEIDVCWPEEEVGLVCFGGKGHQDCLSVLLGIEALSALGWKIVAISEKQLRDPSAFDAAMKLLARYMSRRIRKPAGWAEKNRELRKCLEIERA